MSISANMEQTLLSLRSPDPEIVLETIENLKETGNHLILDGIFDLLHDTQISEIKKSILTLLSELKSKESIPILISAIVNEKYRDERTELVACCWQNGLNYTEYLPLFIDLVIDEPFLTAFEAFTVIENMYGRIDDEVIGKEIIKITEAFSTASDEKAYLLNGLLTIIRDIPEMQEYNL
jgi:hypothetical protein